MRSLGSHGGIGSNKDIWKLEYDLERVLRFPRHKD
jgi:hypothetical protein